jgi:soluble lytic murein transglycosylase-like protein
VQTIRIAALSLLMALLAAPALRAEYVVLRSGLRLSVTGYQLVGDRYVLQMKGGRAEVAAAEVVAIEPEEVFTPLPPAPAQSAPLPFYRDLVEAAAKKYNLDADLITSVIAVESNFDPKAVSRKNARGLMQLLPETAVQLGVKNIDDPAENIDAGTHYLRDLLQKYNNDLALALAAYNAGPEKVQLYGNVPPYTETISYVRRVKRGYAKSKSNPSVKTPAQPAATPASGATGTSGTPTGPSATTSAPSTTAQPATTRQPATAAQPGPNAQPGATLAPGTSGASGTTGPTSLLRSGQSPE